MKTGTSSGATISHPVGNHSHNDRQRENELVHEPMDVDHGNDGMNVRGNNDHLAKTVAPKQKTLFNLADISIMLHRINLNKYRCKFCSKTYESEASRDNHAKFCVHTPAGSSRRISTTNEQVRFIHFNLRLTKKMFCPTQIEIIFVGYGFRILEVEAQVKQTLVQMTRFQIIRQFQQLLL